MARLRMEEELGAEEMGRREEVAFRWVRENVQPLEGEKVGMREVWTRYKEGVGEENVVRRWDFVMLVASAVGGKPARGNGGTDVFLNVRLRARSGIAV